MNPEQIKELIKNNPDEAQRLINELKNKWEAPKMQKQWEDLEVKTFIASSPEEIDKLVNEFRKTHEVRFCQAYATGIWHARMISFVAQK